MDFVKKHLLMLISAVVAVLALVILFLGISQLGGMKELLDKAQSLAKQVEDILKGVPVQTPDGRTVSLIPTQKVNDEMKKLKIVFDEQGDQTLQKALLENIGYDPATKNIRRRLLMDGIFPKPVSDDRPFKFPQKYKEAIDGLLPGIQAGEAPTSKEIEAEKEALAQDDISSMEETKDKGKAKPANPDRRGYNVGLMESAGQAVSESDDKAVAIAANKKADTIKVYCSSISALDYIPNLYQPVGGNPPSVEMMWWGQLAYWIQSDILNSIAQVNTPAKNVRESTVKHILEIRVSHGYHLVTEDGRSTFVGLNDIPSGPQNFAYLASEKYYDIVRFQVDLIIDARKIPQWIDSMYKQTHCLLYMWNIQAADSLDIKGSGGDVGGGPSFGGMMMSKSSSLYKYGSSPVVRLKSWWETYLLRDFYHWGIVGYGRDKETGKLYGSLYNGKKQELEDMEQRTGLEGLMPKTIRQALGSEAPDTTEGAGVSAPPRAPRPQRNPSGNEEQ